MLAGGIICWWPERRRLRIPVKETYAEGAALANKGNGDRSVGTHVGDSSEENKTIVSKAPLSHAQDTGASEEPIASGTQALQGAGLPLPDQSQSERTPLGANG